MIVINSRKTQRTLSNSIQNITITNLSTLNGEGEVRNGDEKQLENLNGNGERREEEACSYDIEISWFMKEEFPKVGMMLRETLKDITAFIMRNTNEREFDERLNNLEDSRIVNFKSTNELLNGYLVLEGWNIVDAELNLKFNNQGKVPVKTTIKNHPLKLEQIQSIYYYCTEALEQFDDLLSAYSDEEMDLNISNKILDVVLNKLRAAKDQLLKPNNVSFESNVQNKKIFKPPLPNDIIVDFKIKNSAIIVTTALLQSSNTNTKKSGTPKSRSLTSSGKSFYSRRQNQHYDILEQNSVECKPKKLETLCTLIQNAYSIALSCKEKNIVLQSLIHF